MKLRRTARILAVLLALSARAVVAQEVRGRITAAESREPLTGVFVMLRDSTGARWAGALTDSSGVYRLRTPQPGTYTVEAERLGYDSRKSAPFVLHPAAIMFEDLVLEIKPIVLPAVSASRGNTCDIPRARAARVAQLWDEARKGLNVASWAAAEQLVEYEFVRYSRELDSSGKRSIREYVEERTKRMTGSPWSVASAEEMSSQGFQREINGMTEYYVPHADVLLSPQFTSSHCFDLVDQRSERDRIGLQFRPLGRPSITDVQGVIWLNRRTLALQTIDYEYVRYTRNQLRTTSAGGTVDFAYLPSGLWVMAGWHARFLVGPRNARPARIHDGSQVMRALVDGNVIWSAPVHRQLDRSRAVMADSAFDAPTGINALPVLSAAGIAAYRCGPRDGKPERTVELVGFVADTGGLAISGTPLRLAWTLDGTVKSLDTTTDANGIYVFCGLPPDHEVVLSIAQAGTQTQSIFLHTRRGMILTRSFFLK
jgi:hypothetical protein